VNDLLATLEPKALWTYFFELSKIPRGSKAEAEAAAWVAEQGRKLGCEVHQDAVGNVLIRKKATPGKEGSPCLAMQAHVDMVCEKNEGTQHDFTKDPIQLRRVGDNLYATGTTLGADNGIGVCAGLAIIASKDVAHGPIELLVTIDEETGLTGANNLQPSWMKAKYLLNLDSEEEGYLTIGCAGGIDTIATRKLTLAAPTAGKKAFRLKVFGLKGGHSGIDINTGRANAIRLLGQLLGTMMSRFGMELASVKGGNKRNAIAREASAYFYMEPGQEAAFKAELAQHEAHWKGAYGTFDPGISFALEADQAGQAMSAEDAVSIVALLLTAPHGVEAMSPDIPGLVQTSTNLGVIDTKDGKVEVNFLSRSSIDPSKFALAERIAAACTMAGFSSQLVGGYPGWKPEPDASLVKTVNEVNQKLFGKPMHIMAIHAGLECGIIGEKYPGMEMVSIGPDMWDVHTPDEHVNIPSVANFWKLLVAIVEKV